MNNRLFISDPDFLMVRSDATASDLEFHHNPYHWPGLSDLVGSRSGKPWSDAAEPRIWATLIALSGGAITLADHIGKLNRTGLNMINTVLELASSKAAKPLDLFENIYPSLWLREENGKKTLGLINWSDTEKEFSLTDYPPNGREIWTNKTITKNKIQIPPHDAGIIVFP